MGSPVGLSLPGSSPRATGPQLCSSSPPPGDGITGGYSTVPRSVSASSSTRSGKGSRPVYERQRDGDLITLNVVGLTRVSDEEDAVSRLVLEIEE